MSKKALDELNDVVMGGVLFADAPPLDPSRVFQIGFLIAEKQEGSFRLDVYRTGAG